MNITNTIISELQEKVRKNPDEPRYFVTKPLDWRWAVTAIIRPLDEDHLLRVEVSKTNEDGKLIEAHNKASSYIIHWGVLKEMLRDTIAPYGFK